MADTMKDRVAAAQKLSDLARADGFRAGQIAMRERAAETCWTIEASSQKWIGAHPDELGAAYNYADGSCDSAAACAEAIRALPIEPGEGGP